MQGERRYEVIEALGTGGFGTVYRARYLGEGGFTQMVALKVLNPEMAAIGEIASRLRDEARVLGLVRHRAIVQVHRLVQLDEGWTVVMELVEGADLAQVLKAGITVPMGPALEIVSEVAAALHVAWSSPGPDGRPLRLLHRDIKPSNIQITPVGEVKVLDFGIARADFDEREAMTKKLAFGSTEYMAPERLDMMDGPAADVYSLGTVLYEILTGKGFGRTSAVRERHVPRVDKAVSALRQALGPRNDAIVELVADMLGWDPALRPDARAVERRALTLRGHMPGEPLRFWAEDHVPRAMAAREVAADRSRTGSILIERPGQGTSAETMGLGAWSEGATPPPADAAAPVEPAAVEPHPAKQIKRRAADPTDAPSVAFAIGPQPKAPRQLGPAPAALPAPLPPEPDESPLFRDAATELPGSPTLVALVDPAPAAPPRDLAAAAAASLDAPAAAPASPAPALPAPAPPAPALPAPAPPAPALPVPAEPAPVPAAAAATLPADDATEDWLPPRRRSPLPYLVGAAALVFVVGLGLALRGDPAPTAAPAAQPSLAPAAAP
ncbi:serine/threonine protein kinase, partial [Myxococcota bacterium]|nr:serine/threonine protein kinase [Myxococcota bacterium]